MTALLIVAGIALLVLIFILRTILHRDMPTISLGHEHHEQQNLLTEDMKLRINEAESDVCRKADTVARMAEEEAGAETAHEEEETQDSLNETSFMKAISDKVERVKRISGAKP